MNPEPLLRLIPASKRKIIAALAVEREMDADALAGLLGLHVGTTEYHLRQMTAAGVVTKRSTRSGAGGRARQFYSLAAGVLA